MPFVQIYLPVKFTADQKESISLAVHESLMTAFNVPKDDYFHVISQLDQGNLLYPASYLGIPHSDNMLFIYITCGVGRTVEMKKALYALIVEKIEPAVAISPDDVMIILNEIAWENWSFGQGKAQMVK